ncbi:MAG TPA: hypothetical protein VK964_09660 [Nocardioidaceae bacterium]|nr:hypothetical protein [Nocardioidaceae bacterium]
MSDMTEVERLRTRVAELEAQQAAGDSPEPPQRRSVGWAVGSAILIIVACVLAPLSVASVWASNQLSDTDQYVQTVAPLSDDPAVQDALANEVTTAVFENLDVEGFTTEALQTIAAQPDVPPRVADLLPTLAVPITDGVESFTRDQVDAFFASPQFAELWAEVNGIAHEQVVRLLEGNEGGAVSAQDNQITLNLAPIVAAVQARMVDRGFELAANIPEVDRTFVLAESDAITQAQGFYSTLNTLGMWLPIITLVLLVVGVVLARDRRRALLKGALGIAAAMVVLGVALTLTRMWYVETTPADILSAEAAGGVFDTIVRFLRTSLRALAVAALVVALAAFLAGPSAAAMRTRATFERGIGSARGGAEHAGWDTGRFGAWVFAHRRALQVTTLIVGGLVIMFWTQPTAWVVVWTALAVVLALALVEFLGTPPTQPMTAPEEGAHTPTVPRQMPRTPEGELEPMPTASMHGADQAPKP